MSGAAFVANASRWRVALLVIGAVAFVVAGLWIAGLIGSIDRPKPIIGWASILFFGLCGIVGIARLRKSGPVMRIDAEGIWWRQWSGETIPWSAISHLSVMTIGRQKMVAVHLVDASFYPSSTIAGRMSGANRRLFGGDIYLTPTGTDKTAAAMIEAVGSFAPPELLRD